MQSKSSNQPVDQSKASSHDGGSQSKRSEFGMVEKTPVEQEHRGILRKFMDSWWPKEDEKSQHKEPVNRSGTSMMQSMMTYEDLMKTNGHPNYADLLKHDHDLNVAPDGGDSRSSSGKNETSNDVDMDVDDDQIKWNEEYSRSPPRREDHLNKSQAEEEAKPATKSDNWSGTFHPSLFGNRSLANNEKHSAEGHSHGVNQMKEAVSNDGSFSSPSEIAEKMEIDQEPHISNNEVEVKLI